MKMEDPVNATLEKIKLQEQDKEAKLKEKRELEAIVSTLNKATREATVQMEKSEQEQEKLTKSTDSLRRQKMLEECRRDALSAQLNSLKNELKELREKSSEEIFKVWKMRSSFCHEVHTAADACDVWTLLIKPGRAERVFRNVQKRAQMPTCSDNENKLQIAIERRVKALAERDRLTAEPDNGEEFMRNYTRPNRFLTIHRPFSTELKENEPIKFSTSNAAKRAVPSVFRNRQADDMPWYQPWSVVTSVAVFLIYFCVLREENDVDQEFSKTLYERIKGLEKQQLLLSYKFNKENGLSVIEIEKRLAEIEAEEAKLEA